MKSIYTAYISPSRRAECNTLIETGVFDNLSNLIEFSLRYFLMDIELNGYSPDYMLRETPYTRNSIKVNDWLIDRILNSKVVSKSDLYDYSLEHLFKDLEKTGILERHGKKPSSQPADRPGAGVPEVEEPAGSDVRDGRGSVGEGDGDPIADRCEGNDVGQVAGDPVHRYASHRNRCGHIISFNLLIFLNCDC